MAQLQRFHARMRFQRGEQDALLLLLLAGSLLGALCARLSGGVLPASFPLSLRQLPLLRAWVRASLFSTLLAAASLLRCRPLTRLLFFAKGALTAWILCAFAGSGLANASAAFRALLTETALPLPLCLLLGSLRHEETGNLSPELLLLLSALAVSLAGVLVRVFL